MILKKIIGAGAIAGALGLSAIGLAGVADAASSGGGGGSSSSPSEDSGSWPPKSDVQWPPKQDNDGGGDSNEGGGSGGGGSPPSTPIVMPFGQPAPTKTAAPLTNQSANSSDESKPIVPVNAPPLGTATSIVLPAQ
jgi:hypothetical protein